MPYKDPGRKRQWEQVHRQERAERRRSQRRDVRLPPQPCPSRDVRPAGDEGWGKGWVALLMLAAILFLAFLGGLPLAMPGRDK